MTTDALRWTSRSRSAVAAILGHAGLAVAVAAAQCAQEQAILRALDGGPSDEFGWAVASGGNVALIGAWRDSAAGSLSGSAYVFRFDGVAWTQQQKIVPEDLEALEFFGWSVALDGDTAVIGNISDDDAASDAGSVYVYVFDGSTWRFQAKLLASDAAAGDHFGVAVAVSGDTLLVGADLDSDNGTWSGSAYVFERQGGQWTERQKLLPSTPSSYAHFGAAVGIDRDSAVVGAYGGPGQLFRGTAYVYRRSAGVWQEEASLVGSQSESGDFFAAAVAISNGRVLCGARWADLPSAGGPILDTGEAYIFVHDGGAWQEEVRLTEAAPGPGDGLGYSVSLQDSLALIGVHNRDGVGTRSGEALLFRHDGLAWQREPRLIASATAAGDMFGLSVALGNRFAVIGAPHEDQRGSDAGAAYVFDLAQCLPSAPGDVDGDGDVDLSDLALLLASFGLCSGDAGFNDAADFDANGCIELGDLATLLGNFGM
jgi:hypothetical protein